MCVVQRKTGKSSLKKRLRFDCHMPFYNNFLLGRILAKNHPTIRDYPWPELRSVLLFIKPQDRFFIMMMTCRESKEIKSSRGFYSFDFLLGFLQEINGGLVCALKFSTYHTGPKWVKNPRIAWTEKIKVESCRFLKSFGPLCVINNQV